ncbi:P-loop containing nucleoside triphosphate hydrolase protein [Mycena metata]|uniref:DNA 3'-5' helicase n=1 Tax=Mycena metata TaxID=1033252 RepID=A0AAD7GUY9_9AGAR|nr:P-loop containing nucleoside triphosphate hydrolase protein [Mycena metata]
MPPSFKWTSPEGHTLARRILNASPLPYDPHDYQIEGVCSSLDGVDLFAITPTGSGKTGFYTMYMLIILAVLRDESLCPTAKFPADPCLIVVCPTIPLQLEMAKKMTSVGLTALAINNDTREEALRVKGEELWVTARKSVNVILAGPEQLKSDEFEKALRDDWFYNRCCGTGVDEVHLLNSWGARFRKDFLQLGFVQARMTEKHNPWILTSASVRHGAPYDNILELFGLVPGQFHLIRRSNHRPDVQILFREFTSTLDSGIYPELDFILKDGRATIIFPKTISLGSKIYSYLQGKCPTKDRNTHIRFYNSMNFDSHNATTRALLENPDINAGCQIVIGTDTLSIGIDMPVRQDAIIIGDIEDADDFVQKAGRVGRNRRLVNNARVIVYVTPAVRTAAEKALRSKDSPLPPKSLPPDLSMAELIVAPCKVKAQDELYENPLIDAPCKCKSCIADPFPTRRTSCNCSGCVPEVLAAIPKPPRPSKPIDTVKKRLRITKLQRAHGTERLVAFGREVWREADISITSFLPPEAFLPATLIQKILDLYPTLTSQEAVSNLIKSHKRLENHHTRLYSILRELKPEFAKISADRKAELAAAKAAKKKVEAMESDEGTGSGSDKEETAAEPEPEPVDARYASDFTALFVIFTLEFKRE